VGALFRSSVFERGEQPVGVTLMALVGEDTDVDDLRHTTSEGPTEAPDPFPNFVRKDEMAFLKGIFAGAVVIPLGEIVEPGGKLLPLVHLANGQLAIVLDHGLLVLADTG